MKKLSRFLLIVGLIGALMVLGIWCRQSLVDAPRQAVPMALLTAPKAAPVPAVRRPPPPPPQRKSTTLYANAAS